MIDFTTRLAEKRYQNREATRYGLAAALLRAKDFPRAMQELDSLERDGVQHPMIEAMAGQILQQSGQHKAALKRYEPALARYPQHLQLIHDYPRTLLLERRFADVVRFTEQALQTRRADANLHQMAAEAYAAQGNAMQSFHHQGEYYAARGDSSSAIEQLELAVRADSGEGADMRDLLVIETRLKALRERQPQEAGQRGPSGDSLARMTQPEKKIR